MADFLTKAGVSNEIKTALKQLVLKQPADPIDYLSKFFENLARPSRQVSVLCTDLLMEVDASKAAELDAVLYKVFTHLSEADSEDVLSGRVQGSVANKLLREMCCNLDVHIADPLMSKLQVPPEAVLSFSSFKALVTPTLSLQAFLKMAKQVFDFIDVQQSGNINKQIGEDLLSRLSTSLATAGQKAELAKTISPAEIALILERSPEREGTMPWPEFEQRAAKAFINHIPSIPL